MIDDDVADDDQVEQPEPPTLWDEIVGRLWVWRTSLRGWWISHVGPGQLLTIGYGSREVETVEVWVPGRVRRLCWGCFILGGAVVDVLLILAEHLGR